jgi:hypothetical protein
MGATFGRALAAVVYALATLLWAGAMLLDWGFRCIDGDCADTTLHRLDLSLLLSVIGLAVAVAVLLAAVRRHWLGVWFLLAHVVIYAINLGVFWDLAKSPLLIIPPAVLVAAVGYFAVGGAVLRSSRTA